MSADQNLTQASHQWATRPDDQRFMSLGDLQAMVETRKRESWTATPQASELRVLPADGNDLEVEVYDPTAGRRRALTPSNFAFGQLAGYAKAPASYLRQLPNQLAAINLQWGLEHNAVRGDALMLAQSNGHNVLRAMTSTSYGRIWDLDVVKGVQKVNESSGGRWVIPAASYTTKNPRRATTLYASDRDVFIFLVDDRNPIEHKGEQLFRGFMTWNSEVGSAVFGLTTFLYRYVCDNRIIWGATEVKELKIRHTGGAPDRFQYEGAKYLRKYAEESTVNVVAQIEAAKNAVIPVNKGTGETVADWLSKRGFTKAQAKGATEAAHAEEGGARSVWDIVNGITAYARSVPHTDDRVQLERQAGKLLDAVTK